MAYRDDVAALEIRHAALEEEVAERARARDEVAQMLAEARARDEMSRRLADLAVGGPARRRRHRILIAAALSALVLLGVGVGYRLAQPAHDHTAEVFSRFALYADQICSCTDAACAQQVSDAMARWAESLPLALKQRPPDLTEAQKKQMMEIATRMTSCMTKLHAPPEQAEAP
jgi:hypothetical protein